MGKSNLGLLDLANDVVMTDDLLLSCALSVNHPQSIKQAISTDPLVIEAVGEDYSSSLFCIIHAIASRKMEEYEGVDYLRQLWPLLEKSSQKARNNVLYRFTTEAMRYQYWELAEWVINSVDHLEPPEDWNNCFRGILHYLPAASDSTRKLNILGILPRKIDIKKHLDVVNPNGNFPIHEAVVHLDRECLEQFIAWGDDPMKVNVDKSTLLHVAVIEERPLEDTLDLLLSVVGKEKVRKMAVLRDIIGFQPIHHAAGSSWFQKNSGDKRLDMIFPNGDIDSRFDQPKDVSMQFKLPFCHGTALAQAFYYGDLPSVKCLLAHGASTDELTSEGYTPWHLMTGFSKIIKAGEIEELEKLVQIVQQLGISPEKTTHDGLAPLSMEMSEKYREILVEKRKRELERVASSRPPHRYIPKI